MVSGFEIIVFSDELGRYPFSCQHILTYFFDSNRVIWVTPTGMRNPKLSLQDLRRIFEKARKWSQAASLPGMIPQGAMQINPVALPYNNLKLIRAFNNQIVKSKVKRKLKEGAPRLVITTLPLTAEYVASFGADAIVYYIVDNFAEWPGIDRDYIVSLEEHLIAQSDVLIASSEKLCEIKARGKRPALISHGVDFEHFYAPTGAVADSDIYRDLERPIIGFFGAISPWLDLELLAAAASARPDWSFVFIGPVDADVAPLKGFGNVHFQGKVPYLDLPCYARQFQVGIIPFLVNGLTASVNPLKLLEYFACGLPVVSTDLPEVCRFRDNVFIARDKEEFIRHLEQAVQEIPKGREERQRIAEQNSWRIVAERFSREIEMHLRQHETTHTHND